MCNLPQRSAVYGRQLPASSAGRFDGRAGVAELCVAFGKQAVPHIATQRRMAARSVLPQRIGCDARGCRADLRHPDVAGPERQPDRRPCAVPEVAVIRRPDPCRENSGTRTLATTHSLGACARRSGSATVCPARMFVTEVFRGRHVLPNCRPLVDGPRRAQPASPPVDILHACSMLRGRLPALHDETTVACLCAFQRPDGGLSGPGPAAAPRATQRHQKGARRCPPGAVRAPLR